MWNKRLTYLEDNNQDYRKSYTFKDVHSWRASFLPKPASWRIFFTLFFFQPFLPLSPIDESIRPPAPPPNPTPPSILRKIKPRPSPLEQENNHRVLFAYCAYHNWRYENRCKMERFGQSGQIHSLPVQSQVIKVKTTLPITFKNTLNKNRTCNKNIRWSKLTWLEEMNNKKQFKHVFYSLLQGSTLKFLN